MNVKRRIIKIGMEDFDNGIVEELDPSVVAEAAETEKVVMEDVAEDIQALESLEEAASVIEPEVQQAEVNVAAMDEAERPAVSEVEVVTPEGETVTEVATAIPAEVQPTLNNESTDMEVAEAVKDQVAAMESLAGAMEFGRLADLYKGLGISKGHIPSFESMVKAPRVEYKASLEGLKETLVKIKDAIVAFIKSIWSKIKGAFKAIVTGIKALKNKLFGLKKEADAVTDETLKKSIEAGAQVSGESYGFEDADSLVSDSIAGFMYIITPAHQLLTLIAETGGSFPGLDNMVDKLAKAKNIDEAKASFHAPWNEMKSQLKELKGFYDITDAPEECKDPAPFLFTSPTSAYALDLALEDPTEFKLHKVSVTANSKAVQFFGGEDFQCAKKLLDILKSNIADATSAMAKYESKAQQVVNQQGEKYAKKAEEALKRTDIDQEVAQYIAKCFRNSATLDAKLYQVYISALKNQVRVIASVLYAVQQDGGLGKAFASVRKFS